VILPNPEVLVPHEGAALLLERIESADAEGLTATLVVRGETPYSLASGTWPAWIGPEVMAQAVSAFAALRAGQPYRPRPGLLLGMRRYHSEFEEFPCGASLAVQVRESTRDDEGRAVFDCSLRMHGREIASGVLTVFQPENALECLAEQLQ
jgi:predicted hotdog family 3-hydroxylacyl-ACP dehydratase